MTEDNSQSLVDSLVEASHKSRHDFIKDAQQAGQEAKDKGALHQAAAFYGVLMKVNYRVDVIFANVGYWILTFIVPTIVFGVWGYKTNWHDFFATSHNCVTGLSALMTVIMYVSLPAVVLYFIGWGMRWLYTGRTDHLFGKKKYTPAGPLDEKRKRWSAVFSLWEVS